MAIGIAKEKRDYEKRVAATPETVAKIVQSLGSSVFVEKGAGLGAFISDEAYEKSGAQIVDSFAQLCEKSDVLVKVQRPLDHELSHIKPGTSLIGLFYYDLYPDEHKKYEEKKLTVASLERLPRITRAQSMDILSSQSNLAGYKAVLEACHLSGKAFPLMMTSAGTIFPAKVLIIGAGVAGLQAIATAKRLGAVVSAFDVRAAAKEQVESLGAKFIEVPGLSDLQNASGYAKELEETAKEKQRLLLQDVLKNTDIVITTALIPGKSAPLMITKSMLRDMKPGCVLIDLAVERGGNIEGSKDMEKVIHEGVCVYGCSNLPSLMAQESSNLFARNCYAFLELFMNKENKTVQLDTPDEIIQKTLALINGERPCMN